MADLIVGDIHGCFEPLQAVLRQADFEPGRDTLWCVGDLVARGPASERVLDWCYRHQQSVRIVLGNHDFHLLAIDAGIVHHKPKDKLDNLLAHPQRRQWLDWLREQPLLQRWDNDTLALCHAGIWPEWTLDEAAEHAREIEQLLQSPNYRDLLSRMYHNKPERWSEQLQGIERHRFIINAYTRMRYVTTAGAINLTAKMSPADAPDHLEPWYVARQRRFPNEQIAFGHWAALMGRTGQYPNIYALDTGCVWNNWLTLLHWQQQQQFTARL